MAGKQPQASSHSSQEWLTPTASHAHFFALKKWSTLRKDMRTTLSNIQNALDAMEKACDAMSQLVESETPEEAPSITTTNSNQ